MIARTPAVLFALAGIVLAASVQAQEARRTPASEPGAPLQRVGQPTPVVPPEIHGAARAGRTGTVERAIAATVERVEPVAAERVNGSGGSTRRDQSGAQPDFRRRIDGLARRVTQLEATSMALWMAPTCDTMETRFLIAGGEQTDCAPYRCLPGAGCRTQCSVSSDCLLGHYCISGKCVKK